MVPIHLDALYLQNNQSVLEAMADFTRLPYFNGTRDMNQDIANISEEIVSQPFQDKNLHLKKGIHLHWALPDALTKTINPKIQHGQPINFPPVPNRWLVTRTGGGLATKQWVIESDYLYPEGAGNNMGSVNIPCHTDPVKGKHQPFRYLGRKMPLAAWLNNTESAEYYAPLTAVGYGEPTFAAFYPNCFSVFGFYDGDINALQNNSLSYDVIGWYNKTTQDYLKTFITYFNETYKGIDTDKSKELLNAIKAEFKWTLADENQDFPEQMVCYARLSFQPAGSTENTAQNTATQIAVGNTGTEALSAYLAQTIDPDHKSILEEQLEALHLAVGLEYRQLDIGPKFKEARHEKGFHALPAGSLWTIRYETQASQANAADAHAREQVTLPDKMAHHLNILNLRQQAYDRAWHEIETLRHQLFADWYKYMLCAYPPDDSRDDYPNIDEVKHYITVKGINPLKDKVSATGKLSGGKVDPATKQFTTASDSEPDSLPNSLAAQLATAINKLHTEVENYNKQLNNSTLSYRLKNIASPRYWQPNDPVIMITGDAAKYTSRHGQDGRLREDGLLECQILSPSPTSIRDRLNAITSQIDEIKKNVNGEHIAFNTWKQQSWHPFLLEWEVEVLPVKHQGNLHPTSRDYEHQFMTHNYTLGENQPDLSIKPGTGFAKGANVYNGRCILTPYAGIKLKKEIEVFLTEKHALDTKTVLAQYFAETGETQSDNYLSQSGNIAKVKQWYENKITSKTQQQKAQAPIYTAIRAYAQLQTTHAISQALGGFNAGLLMHKQTMQLPIADPLGFADYQPFTNAVRDAVQNNFKLAPLPLNDFNPIRSGVMNILEVRLIDTFGRIKVDFDPQELITTEQMSPPKDSGWGNHWLLLPPRLVQPARLNFRWLSASQGEQEMNDHPATTPICGWMLPNNLDSSLMFYDNNGKLLGLINQNAIWKQAPGSDVQMAIVDIPNRHLQKVVERLAVADETDDQEVITRKQSFLTHFITVLDSALENIDPENFAQHQDWALLMGRPIAVVRASVNLELQGLPAIHHGWNVFRQDMRRNTRETDEFTQVKFPIRLGEYQQLNDSLIGYWQENDGDLTETFYAPQSAMVNDPQIRTHSQEPLNLTQAIADAPQTVTMLMDPAGKVHATCGILPIKAIDIPPDQYKKAVQNIEITFLSTPILTDQGKIHLPLPNEGDYHWSWLAKERYTWREIATIGTVQKQVFMSTFAEEGEDIWARLIEKGWIVELDTSKARVKPKDQRPDPSLGADMADIEPQIEDILDAGHIGPVNVQATFAAPQEIREGWLKLSKIKPIQN
jgi:hypothetical protein